MQETILSALKTKFEGVEDAILNRVASKLAETAKTEEEAKKQGIEKIKRLEVLRNAIDCNRFEIESIVIK